MMLHGLCRKPKKLIGSLAHAKNCLSLSIILRTLVPSG